MVFLSSKLSFRHRNLVYIRSLNPYCIVVPFRRSDQHPIRPKPLEGRTTYYGPFSKSERTEWRQSSPNLTFRRKIKTVRHYDYHFSSFNQIPSINELKIHKEQTKSVSKGSWVLVSILNTYVFKDCSYIN